ncbi:cis-3-hydroxy-L-proline dehydratase [Defluviimonas salinarum]|uniref:Aconitase family protein n=1 Tax=Defluviimonas salinarum TaxID=2992147 RepID=A0ABT3J639_9RHOB|nr:aconitase family protein [Defluviimonas salinarum]MCW3783149.1 aconitase family protein [Defluviimonas salinarum]
MATSIIAAKAEGPVVALAEGLSFWGGVDPVTGRVIDAHHPACGTALAGRIVMMPTSRGSCSGSGVLLELALSGHAPGALIFREAEDILTLGALIAARMYDRPLAVVRLDADSYAALASKPAARLTGTNIEAEGLSLSVTPLFAGDLALTSRDHAMLAGAEGEAARLAMEIICTMAAVQGATGLIDVTRAHIDGCIYASPANLTFARTMAEMGARVRIPTTTNAISVDHANWRAQGVPPAFGDPAARLADAYVEMGAAPSFTCAPYLLDAAPATGEAIAWAESNAVLYANTVLGARTVKHPDFLDLCIALTGRAPLSGVYLEENRRAGRVIRVELPEAHDDALWPMLGYLAGRLAPDRIPLLAGLEGTTPSTDDLKALCAAFGTTSAAPMLHVAGITPEAGLAPAPGADTVRITRADLARSWAKFNSGPSEVDLVAFGSPHFSAAECRKLADLVDGRHCHPGTAAIVTLGRDTLAATRADGTLGRLEAAGIRIVPDLCWCSISEPVFPPAARTLMTNSGKYAHYAPALSGRAVRFGSLADCVAAALTGRASDTPPDWLT